MDSKNKSSASTGHTRRCSVCQHPEREEIERDFINWQSPITIAIDYGLADRASVYRHAHAASLFAKRQQNIRAALEKLIEKAGEVDVTAAAVVGAIQAYAKINAQGRWIDRTEQVSLNELFEWMSKDELTAYAREGVLPDWFEQTVAATPIESQEPVNG